MEHRYLFLVNSKGIEVFSILENSFESLKFKGENLYLGDINNFWEQWERKVGYIEGMSKVDFCIISESEQLFYPDSYESVEHSLWTRKKITEFFSTIKNEHIKIIERFTEMHVKILNTEKLFKINVYPNNEELFRAEYKENEDSLESFSKRNNLNEEISNNSKEDKIISEKSEIAKKIELKETAKKVPKGSLAEYYRKKTEKLNNL